MASPSKNLSGRISGAILVALLSSLPAFSFSLKEQEQAGANLYRDKGCGYCHGNVGQGTVKGPSLTRVRKTLKPEQIADQIKNGGQRMPSFEDSVTSDEIADLVAYLRAKHRPVPAAPQSSTSVINPGQ